MIASTTQLTPPNSAENHPNSREKPAFSLVFEAKNSGPRTQDLPSPLTSHESSLLASFQSLRFDPFAFAEKTSPEDFLAFISSPAIQTHIAALKAFAEQALSLRILQAQAAAISHLEQVANTTPNPIEKRRAASTLLRGLGLGGLSLGGLPLRGGRTRLSSPSLKEAAAGSESERHHHGPTRQHPQSQVTSSPAHLVTSSSSSPLSTQSSAPSTSLPLATPFPTISDENVANLLLPILREPKKPTNIATLRAFCMPSTTLAGIPIPQDPQTFTLRAIDILIDPRNPRVEHVTGSRASRAATPNHSHFIVEAKTTHGPINRYSLQLARSHPDQPWLINSLSPGHNNFPPEKPP